MFKDYYKILEIEKNASYPEIKSAYRKLAKKYHPDVNKEKGAQEKFKEIGEAYSILSNPNKRKKYDCFWTASFNGEFSKGFDDYDFDNNNFRNGGYDMKEKELLEKMIKGEKVIIVLLSIILIVLIIGVSKLYSTNGSSTTTETESSEYNTEYDVSMFTEIKAKDLKKETKGDTKVIYIGRESCGWCAAFLPNLWQAQDDYGFKTLYIDIAKIIDFSNGNVTDEDAFNTLSKLSGEGYESYMEENFGATPMILIMKDNKIISAQTGYGEYEAFEKVLNNGGIKK